jgi:MoxR-like ATPase
MAKHVPPSSPRERTRTLEDRSGADIGPDGRAPHLFFVLASHRPFQPPARWSLAGVTAVGLGRASRDALSWERSSAEALSIRFPDPWMSSQHAKLLLADGAWQIEDAGSKNGTLLNGVPVKRAALGDGDVIELGHALFLYREALPVDPEAPADIDASQLDVPAAGLGTMVPLLGVQFERVAQIAGSRVSVMILGESGTGKEVVARAIHALSGRRGPFVGVNCGAIPEHLLESELFGHRAGAFSGASDDRPGLVRAADGGTLFLDELGDLPLASQAAFLRVLQEREVMPVGGVRPIPVDLRLVAATNRDLPGMIDAGRFRADLYARVTGFHMELPPLRERREDLGLIVGALLLRLAPDRVAKLTFEVAAARALLRHAWPLNIRELEQALSAAIVLAKERPIKLEDLPPLVRRAASPGRAAVLAPEDALMQPDEAHRRAALVQLLAEHQGSVSAVARALGKDRKQIQRWIKRYAIDPDGFRR